MSHKKEHLAKGLIYALTFILIAIGFYLQPVSGVTDELAQFGLPLSIWIGMFALSGIAVGIQGVMNWRWNAIIFAPILMYVGALFALRFIHLSNAPISTVAVHLALGFLVILDIYSDGLSHNGKRN